MWLVKSFLWTVVWSAVARILTEFGLGAFVGSAKSSAGMRARRRS